jgi:putative chitinase
MKLTSAILMTGTGCSAANAGLWLSPMQAACDKFGITDADAVAAFLANVGVESSSFTTLVENLNYSAQGLANTWPFRYAIDSHVAHKLPNSLAYSIERMPVMIANTTYANRMGNGDINSGDGWKYRGQGPIQLTGKKNIEAFFKAVGLPLTSDPALLQKPAEGAMSAAFFFAVLSTALKSVVKGFDATVVAVNGQSPCSANQGDLRRKRFADVLPLCQAAAKPVATAAVKKAPAAPQETDKP